MHFFSTVSGLRLCIAGFAEASVTACIPVAVFIDGDYGLTDIGARQKNPMPAGTGVANLRSLRRNEEEEGLMSRSERSIAVPTGMIIGALYVVMLVGFSRESYMRRDAIIRAAATEWPALQNVTDRMCRIGLPDCGAVLADAAGRPACLVPDSQPAARLTMRNLRQALGAPP